ncbi:transcriptional repressor DicA [Chlamydia trachomatis]|nr:transcriptional repressor DicA [Chlamydia trachomatis]
MIRLKELRKEKGLTQEELAHEIGVSKITVLRWENEERQIKPDKAQTLADFFGVSVGYLLGYTDNSKRYDDEIILKSPNSDRFYTHSYKQGVEKIKKAFFDFVIDNSLLLTDQQIQAFSSMIADLSNSADFKYFGHSIKEDGTFEPMDDVFEVLKQMKKDGYESIFPVLD